MGVMPYHVLSPLKALPYIWRWAWAKGKSKVAIDLVENFGLQRILILCPLSVVSVWPTQFERHATRRIQVLALDDGGVKNKTALVQRALARQEPVAVVLNYESSWRDPMASVLLKQPWDVVILDESHRIQAPGGKASRFAARLRDHTRYRLALTGTPLSSGPLSVYGQYRFLEPSIFGTSFARMRSRYALMGGFGNHQILKYQNLDEMHTKMYQIAFHVGREVLDLPEATDVERVGHLGPAARKVYKELETLYMSEVHEGIITASNALSKLLRLQQTTSGYGKLEDGREVEIDTTKAAMLREVFEDTDPAQPIVVFARFWHDLDTIHRVAAETKRQSLELSGRQNDLAAWQQPDGAPVLAIQVQSGGVGIDLTRAHLCLYFSVGYSLADFSQSRARVHRPGQQNAVTYVHLIIANTVDRVVYRALQKKQEIVTAILESLGKDGNAI